MQIFKTTFNVLISENYSVDADIDRYHGILVHVLPKMDFLIGTGIFVPGNFNLNLEKTAG